MSATIAIIRTGSTFPHMLDKYGDFDDWIARGLGAAPDALYVLDVPRGDSLALPADTAGVIVTGSHAMVTDREPWSEHLARWLASLVAEQMPILGICYGHQLLAHAVGGTVAFHPGGREMGTVPIHLTMEASRDPLFCALPSTFLAHAAHSQSVRQLPAGAALLASNEFERHHAFRIGPCAWGIQFHPEFNAAIMQDYLEDETPNPAAVDGQVADTPVASSLLQRFARFAVARTAKERAGLERVLARPCGRQLV